MPIDNHDAAKSTSRFKDARTVEDLLASWNNTSSTDATTVPSTSKDDTLHIYCHIIIHSYTISLLHIKIYMYVILTMPCDYLVNNMIDQKCYVDYLTRPA